MDGVITFIALTVGVFIIDLNLFLFLVHYYHYCSSRVSSLNYNGSKGIELN